MRTASIALVVLTVVGAVFGTDNRGVPLTEVAERAVQQSKLTLSGSAPFHLKAHIVETTNPDSGYRAEIEEYWVSPDKFRRTITSPEFSQVLIVNGDRVSEEDKGDYLPWWLNDLLTAIFDPLPMVDKFRGVEVTLPKMRSGLSNSCSRMQTKIGVPPAENSAFWVFCFQGSDGVLESVVTPGYQAEFGDFRPFKNKHVARHVVIDPESGTTIEARITELTELGNPDENMFNVEHPTSEVQRIKSIEISEATAHSLFADTPEIVWPAVRSGKTSGVLSLYVSVDRSGRVREAWPLNSDNAGLEDSAREQVMKWKFKPAQVGGIPVQVETTITLAFTTKIGNPIQILSDADARRLATKVIKPVFPAGTTPGTEVKVQIGVGLDGSISGVSNPYNVPTPLFMAAYAALREWHFNPYLRDGRPDVFGADIVFRTE